MSRGPNVRTDSLRVLLADEDEAALQATGALVEGLGHEVISSAVNLEEATEAIAREEPDVSLVLVHSDDSHALELIEEIAAFSNGPVIALLGEEDPPFIAAAAERGIAASVRPGSADAIQNAIEVALRRHSETERLEEKVSQLQSALERRSVIERAKGMLMERHALPERAAFELLRGKARAENKTVVALAGEVVGGLDLAPDS